jgi:hypothetical protein
VENIPKEMLKRKHIDMYNRNTVLCITGYIIGICVHTYMYSMTKNKVNQTLIVIIQPYIFIVPAVLDLKCTEFHSIVIHTPASYSGDFGLESWLSIKLSWLRYLMVFFRPC